MASPLCAFANRTQGVSRTGRRAKTPCYLLDCHASFHSARPLCAPHGDDELNKLCNDRKKSVITSDSEVIHIKNLSKFSTSINSDNLSEKNQLLRLVINNFKSTNKEDIRMRNIKKILTTILSISLLFATSCISPSIPQETKGKDTIIINNYFNSDNAYEDKNPPAGEYLGLFGNENYKATVTINPDGSCKITGKAAKKGDVDKKNLIDFEITVGGWMGKDNSYSANNITEILPTNMSNATASWSSDTSGKVTLGVVFECGEQYSFWGQNSK